MSSLTDVPAIYTIDEQAEDDAVAQSFISIVSISPPIDSQIPSDIDLLSLDDSAPAQMFILITLISPSKALS